MPNIIVLKCKHCGQELILDELLEAQIAEKFNNGKLNDLKKKEDQLKNRELEFEQKRKRENELFAKQVNKKTIEMQTKLDNMTAEIAELQQKAKTALQTELELRKHNKMLLQEKDKIELEIIKRVENELEKTRLEVLEVSDRKHELTLFEKEKTISDLRTLVDTLSRKLIQGSQQKQGEVGELHVEEILRKEFPADEIHPVPKGQLGADILLDVIDKRDRHIGKIIIEVKRTKNWSSNWIDKIKKDQREARADIAVIISEALPDMGNKKFANIDGVWVCDFYVFRELITVLRHQLKEANRINLLRSNEKSKAMDVYNYVSGNEFRQNVSAMLDSLDKAKENLYNEKTFMNRIWSKQEKLIEQVIYSTIKVQSDIEVFTGSPTDPPPAWLDDDIA